MANRQITLTVIPIPNYTNEDLTQRLQIRERALIYAEYELFSEALMRNPPIACISERDWKLRVEIIEFHLLLEINLRLQYLDVNDWQPKNIFFNELYILETQSNEPEEIFGL